VLIDLLSDADLRQRELLSMLGEKSLAINRGGAHPDKLLQYCLERVRKSV